MSSLFTLTLCHSQSLSFSFSLCLSCLSLWLLLSELDKSAYSCIHHMHLLQLCRKPAEAATFGYNSFFPLSKWRFGNRINVTPNSITEAENGRRKKKKKACLIIFLITSVTIPKLFFYTESAGEYANRQCCTALVCGACVEQKKKKKHIVVLSCFQKESEKWPRILFITPGINSA